MGVNLQIFLDVRFNALVCPSENRLGTVCDRRVLEHCIALRSERPDPVDG